MRARRLAAIVVGGAASIAGCASVPDNPVGSAPLLDVDATTGRVSTGHAAPIQYAVELAAGDVRMPQSLVVDGVDRLGKSSCPDESGIGVGIVPAFDAVPRALGGPPATGGLNVDLAGPVIARIDIDWTVPFTCAGTQQARGTARFTMFPNGRIVRHDIVRSSSTALVIDGGDCGCGVPTSFSLTDFWTFAPGQVVNPDGSPWTDGSQAGCIVYADHMIGVAWPGSTTHLHQTAAIASFVFDWVAGASTLVPDDNTFATSAIILSAVSSPARCGEVLADLDDFTIQIDGKPIVTDDSGIYIDTRPHADPVVISASRVFPKGFAISLDVGESATVSRSPEMSGDWYGVQPVGAVSTFWFRDGLQPGESITITPR